MQKLMKAMHKNEKGFTLVELMVVVVIIGILVAIAIPIYNTITAGSETSAIEANLRTINGAISMMIASQDAPSGGWDAGEVNDELVNYLEGWTTNDNTEMGPGGTTYQIIDGGAGTGSFRGQATVPSGIGPNDGTGDATYVLTAGELETN